MLRNLSRFSGTTWWTGRNFMQQLIWSNLSRPARRLADSE
jgi:hypothetical protein